MTSLLASIRPDSWNFPLFLHVLGAMVLVGAVTTSVAGELVATRTAEPARVRRVAFRALLFVGLPAYIVMRVGAEWLYSKEFEGIDGRSDLDRIRVHHGRCGRAPVPDRSRLRGDRVRRSRRAGSARRPA